MLDAIKYDLTKIEDEDMKENFHFFFEDMAKKLTKQIKKENNEPLVN